MTPSTTLKQPPRGNPGPLPPARHLAVGTLLTIRMRGHSRTDGREYFAPAIVLGQYDNQTGDIEVLVFDSSAGMHYRHDYPIREVSVVGDGNERYLYESQSNIGEILLAPDEIALGLEAVAALEFRVKRLEEAAAKAGNAAAPAPVQPPAQSIKR